MLGEIPVLPEIDGGVTLPLSRIQGCVALATEFCCPAPFAALTLTAGGECEGVTFVATQKTRRIGVTVMVFWAEAVSKVPNATNSTKAINAMDLKGIFTDFSSGWW